MSTAAVTDTPPSKPAKSLGARSVDAVFWGAGGTVLRLALQMGSQIAMARLLGPDQYGLFAIGATVISFSNFFSDVGLAYGLIQKKEVSERDVRFVVTWQVILGIAVTLAIWGAAAPIARFFGEPRATSVVQALATICLVNALAAPSLNLLKRELDFRSIQLAQIVSYLVGYFGVGIPMALHGSQVWALVAAWSVQAVVNTLLLYRAVRHPLRPLVWYEQARTQSGYGATVLVTNIVNWCINNIDRVVVGRVFGARDIGLYATSYNLLYNPTTSMLAVVQQVFFSASARVADERQRLVGGYLALLGAVTTFLLPVFVCVSAVSGTFMLALYGNKWASAAPLCQALALAMPLFLVWGLSTPLLWASGNPGREFRVQLPVALVWLGTCVLASHWSVTAIAWTVAGLFGLRCGVILVTCLRTLEMPAGPIVGAVSGGVLVSVLMAAACALVDRLAGALPPLARLALEALAAAATWYAVLRVRPTLLGPDLRGLLARMLGRLPAPLARPLAFLGQERTNP